MKFFKTMTLILCSTTSFCMIITGPNYGDLQPKQRPLDHVDVFAFFHTIDSTYQTSSNPTPSISRSSADEEVCIPFSSSFIEETRRFNEAFKKYKAHKKSQAITNECIAPAAYKENITDNETLAKVNKNRQECDFAMMFINKKNHSESPFEQWAKRNTPTITITPPCDDIPCNDESKNEDTFFIFE